MATGDNVLTAISIARQCGIVTKFDTVYLGELAFEQQTNKPFIAWTTQDQVGPKNPHLQDVLSNNSMDKFLPQSLPWDYQDNNISIALTGPAFNHAL